MKNKEEFGFSNQKIEFKEKPRAGMPKGNGYKNFKEFYAKDPYPHNHVTLTKAGHIFEWDNSKGKERIHFGHCSGTGFEILKDGSRIERIVGNEYRYNKGGITSTVDGNVDHKVGGHLRENVDGGHDTTVAGERSEFVKGNKAGFVGGNYTQQTTKAMTMQAGETMTVAAGGDGKDTGQVRMTLGKDGVVYVTGAKHLSFTGGEDVIIRAGKSIGLEAPNINLNAASTINAKAGKTHNLGGTIIQTSGPIKTPSVIFGLTTVNAPVADISAGERKAGEIGEA